MVAIHRHDQGWLTGDVPIEASTEGVGQRAFAGTRRAGNANHDALPSPGPAENEFKKRVFAYVAGCRQRDFTMLPAGCGRQMEWMPPPP